jgi:hypothetical protein
MSYSYASNLNLRGAQRGAALTTATSSFVGVVRVDNTTLLVDANGTISVDSTALNNLSSFAVTNIAAVSSFAVTNIAAVSSFAVTNIASVSSTLYSLIFAPKTLTTKQTFLGNVTSSAVKITNALEGISVSSTVATGTINFDATQHSILYFTGAASGNWTINFRANGSNSLDSIMSVGEALTVVHMVTNTGTAFYNNVVNIDGAATTTKWQGGSAPTAGNINSVDSYSYTIVKTASATFTVFASQTRFA